MNINPMEQNLYSANDTYLGQTKPELMQPSFHMYEDPLTSYSNSSIISHLQHRRVQDKRISKESLLYLQPESRSSLQVAKASQEDWAGSSSKGSADSMSPKSQPSAMPSPEDDRMMMIEQHQAKRARVENIIKGMVESPDSKVPKELEDYDRYVEDSYRIGYAYLNNTEDNEYLTLQQQLRTMQRRLRQLQERFVHVHKVLETNEETEDPSDVKENWKLKDNSYHKVVTRTNEAGQQKTWENNFKIQQDLSDTLKYELSMAVSQSVDLVFRNFSPLFSQSQINVGKAEAQPAVEVSKPQSVSCFNIIPGQTEALSLVVRKPCSNEQAAKTLPFHFSSGENRILEHLLRYGPPNNLKKYSTPYQSGDRCSADLPWNSVKGRSKTNSSPMDPVTTANQSLGLEQGALEHLSFPQVKVEQGGLQGEVERSPYLSVNIQEGLTPNHLKKAKLMFFYTRYPSSNVLKTYFLDVKFNRCVTSQLIKWFSNFREFYYIQMEKFARQAISEGVTGMKDLLVSKDTELFRALNTHYNKANDFQVPDRFIEVAEITLKEFFSAIVLAKDSDPSWKKAIYKVICKLDSDVPEDFKAFACS